MDSGLKGKSAIVTGGGSHIGKSIALLLAAEGANVVIADIDPEQGEKAAKEIRSLGVKCLSIPTDVKDPEGVKKMIRTTADTFGAVDVLVNNVGWTMRRLFIQKTREECQAEIDLNIGGFINCTHAVLEYMVPQKKGAIVSLGSDAGRIGEPNVSIYAGCKGAIIAMTKSLARELGPHHIRINVVCPGTTLPDDLKDIGAHSVWAPGGPGSAWTTPEMRKRIGQLYPLGRTGTPGEVAAAVVFLASDLASFITGQTLSVSGGVTLV